MILQLRLLHLYTMHDSDSGVQEAVFGCTSFGITSGQHTVQKVRTDAHTLGCSSSSGACLGRPNPKTLYRTTSLYLSALLSCRSIEPCLETIPILKLQGSDAAHLIYKAINRFRRLKPCTNPPKPP